jgi:hypothetical protein
MGLTIFGPVCWTNPLGFRPPLFACQGAQAEQRKDNGDSGVVMAVC